MNKVVVFLLAWIAFLTGFIAGRETPQKPPREHITTIERINAADAGQLRKVNVCEYLQGAFKAPTLAAAVLIYDACYLDPSWDQQRRDSELKKLNEMADIEIGRDRPIGAYHAIDELHKR